jgi:hypothetical protein
MAALGLGRVSAEGDRRWQTQPSMLSQLRAGIDVVCPVRERSGGADAHPSRLDRRDERLHAEDVHDPREIVGEHVQDHRQINQILLAETAIMHRVWLRCCLPANRHGVRDRSARLNPPVSSLNDSLGHGEKNSRRSAVGTVITDRPPPRSVLAGFPHTAPTLGV